jgi:cell wall-associated NlpC family hydrolase
VFVLRVSRVAAYILNVVVLALLFAVPTASAATGSTGGTTYESKSKKKSSPRAAVWNGPRAVIDDNGFAVAPAGAPPQVINAIAAANKIIGKPYRYGGGHAKVEDSGYDCSGTVSYALLGGKLLKGTPLDSSSFMRWGQAGPGQWVTVYTNPGHAFVVIAGLRLDTSAAGDPSGAKGPRWRPVLRSTRGFKARHPVGF